jgi:hypothetical protein
MRFVDPTLLQPIKYNEIRGQIESAFASFFNPSQFSSTATYAKGDQVQVNALVYQAKIDDPTTPPSSDWTLLGPVYAVIYENVKTAIPPNGAIKLEIKWGDSDFVSLPCREGQMKEHDGMLMVWIFTPDGSGTKESALLAERLSELFLSFEESGNGLCGRAVRIFNPSGPKRSNIRTEKSFNVQVMSASLRTIGMT